MGGAESSRQTRASIYLNVAWPSRPLIYLFAFPSLWSDEPAELNGPRASVCGASSRLLPRCSHAEAPKSSGTSFTTSLTVTPASTPPSEGANPCHLAARSAR